MYSAGFSIGIFIGLTIFYFGLKFFLVDRKGPPMYTGMIKTALALTYIMGVIGSQLGINISNTKEHCHGVPQIVTSMIYTIIPNFFMLGLIMVVLKIFPGWKEPFSNTIGYLIVNLMGLGETFSELLRPKLVGKGKKTGGDLISMICENKSIIINQITPMNYELFLNRMGKEGALKSNFKSKPAYNKLWMFVNAKDAIAEMIWYLLTGALAISTTFNAITCDGDTSTNDMATIFATGKVENSQITNLNDKKIQNFDKALNKVLLNLAKRVVSDGEGSSKFVTVNVNRCKSEIEAKQIAFSIANSPLVKTAIAGEDPNWGRIVMAIGKAGPKINLKKLSIKFGDLKIVQDGKLHQNYDEKKTSLYMKNENIDFDIEIFTGTKSFTVYTMDFTKKYIDINADYRS